MSQRPKRDRSARVDAAFDGYINENKPGDDSDLEDDDDDFTQPLNRGRGPVAGPSTQRGGHGAPPPAKRAKQGTGAGAAGGRAPATGRRQRRRNSENDDGGVLSEDSASEGSEDEEEGDHEISEDGDTDGDDGGGVGDEDDEEEGRGGARRRRGAGRGTAVVRGRGAAAAKVAGRGPSRRRGAATATAGGGGDGEESDEVTVLDSDEEGAAPAGRRRKGGPPLPGSVPGPGRGRGRGRGRGPAAATQATQGAGGEVDGGASAGGFDGTQGRQPFVVGAGPLQIKEGELARMRRMVKQYRDEWEAAKEKCDVWGDLNKADQDELARVVVRYMLFAQRSKPSHPVGRPKLADAVKKAFGQHKHFRKLSSVWLPWARHKAISTLGLEIADVRQRGAGEAAEGPQYFVLRTALPTALRVEFVGGGRNPEEEGVRMVVLGLLQSNGGKMDEDALKRHMVLLGFPEFGPHPRIAASMDDLLRRWKEQRVLAEEKQPTGGGPVDSLKRKAEARIWINAWRARTGLVPSIPSPARDILPPSSAAANPAAGSTGGFGSDLGEYVKLVAGLASLYALDMAIKKAFTAAHITFPSALGGMFGVVALLLVVGESAASKILAFYSPVLNWIAKWLPLFYVASLVTLPLALKGIAGSELLKIMVILSVGMAATLLFTAQVTVFIRTVVRTENKEITKAKPASPFLSSHFAAWGAVAVASLAGTVVAGAGSSLGAQMALPFGLAATVGGYLLGNAVPKTLQGLLHPVVVTALVANAGAALHGAVHGVGYDTSLKMYYSKGQGLMGAGDFLMAFLGCVIVSFGFRIYQQRDTLRRHAPEILGATFLSALFSFFSTAFAAKALVLDSQLARALIPRSVTVALALPIATQLDAPLSITAAAVLLQGLLGANFGPNLMTAVGIKDTIARGLAAAGTAGGLGTASLTSKEPEALPFCALSYSLVGILSTFLAATPPVRQALIAIVG